MSFSIICFFRVSTWPYCPLVLRKGQAVAASSYSSVRSDTIFIAIKADGFPLSSQTYYNWRQHMDSALSAEARIRKVAGVHGVIVVKRFHDDFLAARRPWR